MFKSLKEKLKGWIKKNKEEQEEIKEKPKERLGKKDLKKQKKGPEKEDLKKQKEEETKKPEKKPFIQKFKKILTEEDFEEKFEELELILLQNNVAVEAAGKIKESLKKRLLGEEIKKIDFSKSLKESIEEILIEPPKFLEEIKSSLKEKSPFVILFVGINGSGKTTTIAKIANLLIENNLSCCLVAADTFRAAAIQQLEEHAKRLKVPVIKKDYGSDPASVAFDGVSYAKKRKIDVVLIDTAGRMQNRDSLMREVEKISRVSKADMKIFVGESITGNDATRQAESFEKALSLSGIILTKADVDEKGGTAISISSVTKKPIFFLGTGQSYKDLEEFKKKKIIESLGL